MKQISIEDEISTRILAFKEIIETVFKEELSLEACTNLIIHHGINSMITQVIAVEDPTILLTSILQLGQQYPKKIYHFISERLKQGETQTLEELKKRIGFI